MPSVFVEESGSGKTLVFLHGFCETHAIWHPFVEKFSDHRVVTVDLPGFGNSGILPSPFTIDQVADAVGSALANRAIRDAVVIGHSLGGYVALSLLAHHPELVSRIVLFHSSAFADTEEKKEGRNKIVEFVKKNGVQPFIDTFVPGLFFDKKNQAIARVRAIASQTSAEALTGYTLAMRDRPDRRGLWTKNAVQKLLIAGSEDTSIPIEISREMSRIGLNLQYSELPGTGHMGFFEAESECEMIIKRFTY